MAHIRYTFGEFPTSHKFRRFRSIFSYHFCPCTLVHTGSRLHLKMNENEGNTGWLTHGNKTMVAGGVAGCVAKTVTAPLARLTLLYQVAPIQSNNRITEPLMTVCRRILHEEGVLSFWKGNLTSVIHRFPYSAINFYTYDTFTKFVKHHDVHESLLTRFICGASAGSMACICCYPLDLVRTRLMASRIHKTEIASSSSSMSSILRRPNVMGTIVSTMSQIVANEGFVGLYRGLWISLWVTIPTFGISFSVYGTVKENIMKLDPEKTPLPFRLLKDTTTGHLSPYGSMLSGAISGLMSSVVLFPLDVVRRRMQVAGVVVRQVEGTQEAIPKISLVGRHFVDFHQLPGGSNGALAQLVLMIRAEGIRGLYRGILPEVLKITPMVSITFCMYEFCLHLMEDYDD